MFHFWSAANRCLSLYFQIPEKASNNSCRRIPFRKKLVKNNTVDLTKRILIILDSTFFSFGACGYRYKYLEFFIFLSNFFTQKRFPKRQAHYPTVCGSFYFFEFFNQIKTSCFVMKNKPSSAWRHSFAHTQKKREKCCAKRAFSDYF